MKQLLPPASYYGYCLQEEAAHRQGIRSLRQGYLMWVRLQKAAAYVLSGNSFALALLMSFEESRYTYPSQGTGQLYCQKV